MTKSLTENTWVYTEKGIENVHWCNVDGVDELVTPKGKVLAPVPSYDEYKKLQEQLAEANDCLVKLKRYLQDFYEDNNDSLDEYLVKWGIPSEKCQEQGDFPSKKCKDDE